VFEEQAERKKWPALVACPFMEGVCSDNDLTFLAYSVHFLINFFSACSWSQGQHETQVCGQLCAAMAEETANNGLLVVDGNGAGERTKKKKKAKRIKENKSGQAPVWFGLPLELQQMVWSHLQPMELFLLNLVCLRWRTFLVDDQVRNFIVR
jgi:hypothetical protein